MGIRASDCCFDDAKLPGTNFKDSDLTGSSFRNTNCKRACFYSANLTGCDFRGAVLDEAVFMGATLDKSTDFRGASLINAYYNEHRDNAGNFLAAGVNLRAANCDETTKLGDDPTAFPLEILERASEIVKGEFGIAPGRIASLLREAIKAVRAGNTEHWQEDILSQLDEREREIYDELMEQTFESLR